MKPSTPPVAREVMLLAAVAGIDHSDAADICGITPAALRQRLHRARELLSKALERGAAADAPALAGITSCSTR